MIAQRCEHVFVTTDHCSSYHCGRFPPVSAQSALLHILEHMNLELAVLQLFTEHVDGLLLVGLAPRDLSLCNGQWHVLCSGTSISSLTFSVHIFITCGTHRSRNT